jgi:galactokinase
MTTAENILESHKEHFGVSPQFFVSAPGRINIIGEHTDYNLGWVLPTAINKYIFFAISAIDEPELQIYAKDLEQSYIHLLSDDIINSENQWYLHITGVLKEFQKRGHYPTHGIKITYGGNIPNGSGLSSSAAVEAGIAFAINEIFGFNVPKLELAFIAQDTEHHHIGVKCGLMDMYASLFSEKDCAILLDCKTNTHECIPLHIQGYSFVLVNTGVKHNLAESAYNERRRQCEEGVTYFQKFKADVKSLRDVTTADIQSYGIQLNPTILNRCEYVVEENLRVLDTIQALADKDVQKVGKNLYASHEGLSTKYDVSCEELDFLVSVTHGMPKVLGARMMGGGFGGCTINLVENDYLEEFVKTIKSRYWEAYQIDADVVLVENSEGVKFVKI